MSRVDEGSGAFVGADLADLMEDSPGDRLAGAADPKQAERDQVAPSGLSRAESLANVERSFVRNPLYVESMTKFLAQAREGDGLRSIEAAHRAAMASIAIILEFERGEAPGIEGPTSMKPQYDGEVVYAYNGAILRFDQSRFPFQDAIMQRIQAADPQRPEEALPLEAEVLGQLIESVEYATSIARR
ncbi:MAG: hypothetical protein AAFQ53_10820 [Bacteroidota bacterium]